MGVFDKIKSGASNMVEGISETAKNSTETMKLKGDLGRLEGEKLEIFGALGKQYFEAHKDDAECEFGEAVARVNAIEAEKVKIEEQLRLMQKLTSIDVNPDDLPSQEEVDQLAKDSRENEHLEEQEKKAGVE